MKRENNLLASVTLFGELYNSNTYQSIPDILADLIKGAIISKSTFSINSTELKQFMNEVYGFEIPESVLRTVVKTKFKDNITIENKIYHFKPCIKESFKGFDDDVNSITDRQNSILENLYSYIENKKDFKLDSNEKEKIFKDFSNYLLDNDYSDKYSDLISAFLISNEKDHHFKEVLNSVKEGLILYQGINYTDNISQLGHWNTELTIYLSTEHLFSCVGFNGILFEEIFEDFFKLVCEINNKSKSKSKNKNKNKTRKLIELKYLEETRDEIDFFFSKAESIKRGHSRLNPSKEAMVSILKDCDSARDIKTKQVKFYANLKTKGIDFKSIGFNINNSEYNVSDASLVNQLKSDSEKKNKDFNEKDCFNTLRIFTKINTFRTGDNSSKFEKIRHIYISENSFTNYLAHNNKVKFGTYDIPFAKDIDFIISKFWFKLQKGFSNKNDLPKSFDVITKAKIVISSHTSSSLTKLYDELISNYKSDKLTEEEATNLNIGYKEKPNTPEKVTAENVDSALDFLFDDNIQENALREKTRQKQLLENTVKELKVYKDKEFKSSESIRLQNVEKAKNDSAEKEWKLHRKNKFSELRYYLCITLITIMPILLGLIFKIVKPINDYILTFGNNQWFFWGVLLLISAIERLGRSYLFNKDEVKNGWDWLKILLSFNYSNYKRKKISEFQKNFKISQKKPFSNP